MALTDGQKHLAYLLVSMRMGDADYAIRIANDTPFAVSELIEKAPEIYKNLIAEKGSRESHISTLQARLSKIDGLLSTLEELQNNGNE